MLRVCGPGMDQGEIYWEELLLSSCQASAMELLHGSGQRSRRVGYICGEDPTAGCK